MYAYPIQVAWEITGQCNFRCIYCLNRSGLSFGDLTLKERMAVADELVANNILDIIISGGEPLILPDMFDILEKFKANNVHVTLLTNGTLLDDERCKCLKPLVDVLQISLDSLKKDVQEELTSVKDSYATIMEGINCAISHQLPLAIGAVINRLNFDEMGDLARFCVDKGIKHLSISELMPIGRARENFEMLKIETEERIKAFNHLKPHKEKLKITGHEPGIMFLLGGKKDYKCDCSLVSCSISYNGDVFPCSYIRDTIGSIKKDNLRSIWQGTFAGYRDIISKSPAGRCGSCDMDTSCRGGCKGLSWGYTGRIDSPNPICVYNDVI